MNLITTISATTGTGTIINAIPFADMRQHAIMLRDMADAVREEMGDQEVAELYQDGAIMVLFSRSFGYGVVNQTNHHINHSLYVEEISTPDDAAAEWRCE